MTALRFYFIGRTAGEIFVSSRVTLACGRIEQREKYLVTKEKTIVDRCYIEGGGGEEGKVIGKFTKGERWKKDILIRVKIQT